MLASASPRRLALLEQVGITPDALAPPRSTRRRQGRGAAAYRRRLARAKAEAALKLIVATEDYGQAFLLAADTMVAVGRRVLGRADEREAGDALRLLRGLGIACTPPSAC